jgi:hypothetical protein
MAALDAERYLEGIPDEDVTPASVGGDVQVPAS